MAKIQLDTPPDIHAKIKRLQIDREEKGDNINLKELYYEVLKEGLESIKNKKDLSK